MFADMQHFPLKNSPRMFIFKLLNVQQQSLSASFMSAGNSVGPNTNTHQTSFVRAPNFGIPHICQCIHTAKISAPLLLNTAPHWPTTSNITFAFMFMKIKKHFSIFLAFLSFRWPQSNWFATKFSWTTATTTTVTIWRVCTHGRMNEWIRL